MIDYCALAGQIKQTQAEFYSNYGQKYNQFLALFRSMLADSWLSTAQQRTAPWLVAGWSGELDCVAPLTQMQAPYRIIAVDGSQIYPDRHEGTGCALINVGGITIHYGAQARVQLYSIPYLYPNSDNTLTPEIIDCLRQEHELMVACQQAISTSDVPQIVFIDGSLIAWQLQDKPAQIRKRYLTSYLACMQQLYEQRIPCIGYVSVPHNKDIAHVVRWYAHECVPEQEACCEWFVDSDIFEAVLPAHGRSTIFESLAELCAQYPVPIRPLFFYVRVGQEIARLELPRWVYDDAAACEWVERVVLDQCLKGDGYPIALAEAHAQAVVKTRDRAAFYRMIMQEGHQGRMSRKLFCKRRLCA